MNKYSNPGKALFLTLLILVGCSDMGDPLMLYPEVGVTPSQLDYSQVTVGATQSRHLSIANTGQGDLDIELDLIQTVAIFSIAPMGFATVPPDDTLDIMIQFSPLGEQDYTATLQIHTNDPALASIDVLITGEGVSAPVPALSIAQTSLDFGTLIIGDVVQRELTINSIGTDTVFVDSVLIELAGISHNAPITIVLPPGSSHTITLSFTGIDAGSFTGSIAIYSNVNDSPSLVPVSAIVEASVSYATSLQPVWDASCTGCHGSSGGLNLTSYANLMLGTSNNGPVVIEGDGANSLLVRKLRGTAGSLMPVGGPALSESTISSIETWINQGARNN